MQARKTGAAAGTDLLGTGVTLTQKDGLVASLHMSCLSIFQNGNNMRSKMAIASCACNRDVVARCRRRLDHRRQLGVHRAHVLAQDAERSTCMSRSKTKQRIISSVARLPTYARHRYGCKVTTRYFLLYGPCRSSNSKPASLPRPHTRHSLNIT